MRNIYLILFLLAVGIFTEKTHAQAIILKADTVEVPCLSSDAFLVPVRVENFLNVSGLQFTIRWDTARLKYAYITQMAPTFNGAGFDTLTTTVTEGRFTFSWTSLNPGNLPNDAVMFKIGFNRLGGPPVKVSFSDDPTNILAFDGGFNELEIDTEDGLVRAIDFEAPTIVCPPGVTVSGPGPTAVPGIAVVNLADNCETPGVGWSVTGTTMGNFPNDPDASGAIFNLGASTVTYTATDAGGNTSTCSFKVVVDFAIVSSDLTLVASATGTPSCGDQVSFDILAFNYDTISGLQFSMGWDPNALQFVSTSNYNPALNLAAPNFNTAQSGAGIFTYSWTSLTPTTLPPNAVMFTVTFNVLGNGTLSFSDNPTPRIAFAGPVPAEEVPMVTINGSVVVTDNTPPAIECPADVTVQAPATTAVQGIAPVSVSDNCAAPAVGWSVSGVTTGNFPNDPDASGGLFNIGVSTVTYTTTDAGGNTATCSFHVTVEFANNSTDFTLIANSTTVACGGAFSVDVTTLNYDLIAGLQFSMGWDPAISQFTSVSNLNPVLGIALSNFDLTQAGMGVLSYAWTAPTLAGLSVPDGAVLFRLNFNLVGNANSLVNFSDIPTLRTAVVGTTLDEIPVVTFDALINVSDNVPPTISCPANVVATPAPGNITADVNGLEPTTLLDNCAGIPTLTFSQSAPTPDSGTGNANGTFNAGTTTVTYTATDANNNTATCAFTVTVDAGTALILQLDSIQADCQGAGTQITVNLTTENFTDILGLAFNINWDPAVLNLVQPVTNVFPGFNISNSIFYQGAASGLLVFFGSEPTWPDVPDGATLFSLTFNVLATGQSGITFAGPFDALDNSFQPVPLVTINGGFSATGDNTPPSIVCPNDTTILAPFFECNANYNPVQPAVSDACSGIASITIMPTNTVFNSGSPTLLTYTATDDAGNSATCAFTVTIVENNVPQAIGCPANIVKDAPSNACSATATWTAPTFQDACQGTVNVTNNFPPGAVFPLGTSIVLYEATDNSGNVATCSFTVTVRDVTPPTITCPPNQNITPVDGCTATVTFDPPVANDFCDQNLDIACSLTSPQLLNAGAYAVTCAALDDAGNVAQCTFTIVIADAGAPSFPNGCPANIAVASASGNCGANPTWQAPTATDNCDTDLTLTASQPSGSFFDVAGSPHVVTYTATDDLGNTATCTFTVTVTDGTAPTLLNCPTLPILVTLPVDSCTVTLNWTPPTAVDNCGTGGITVTSNLQPGLYSPGDTMVVYTATDASGNSSTCSFNLTVKDVVAPEINCPTQPTVVQNGNACGVIAPWTIPSATDNCTPQNELIFISQYTPDSIFQVGTTTFPVQVIDASGNIDECTITIIVMGQVPGFINIPANIMVNGCDSHVTWNSPVAVGFCPPVTIDSSAASGSVFPFGTTTVTYTASDDHNNVATASFTVTVTETVPPVFSCPAGPITVNVGGSILSDPDGFLFGVSPTQDCNGVDVLYDLPSATDNCVTPTVSLLQGLPSGSLFTLGFNNLIFTAVDSAGNSAQCVVNVEVTPLPALAAVVDPNPACASEVVTITAANIPGATYTWVGPVTSSTNVLTIQSLSAQNDGPYIVSATINGCNTPADTVFVFLPVTPVAENDLGYTIDPGASVDFPSVLENDVLSPAFDFGVTQTGPLAGLTMNPDGTFTYTAGNTPGQVSFFYEVCSVTCPDLCDMASVTITVNDTKCVFIPNIITPNGDDANDWFTIPCLETGLFRENSLIVYNQWGDKVYEASPYSNDPAEAWRGTLDGEPGKDLPDGVYYYIFKPGQNIPPMKGFVEIFR